MAISIRRGRKTDLPFILKLVKELAIYEKETEAVTADLHDYEDGFENNIFGLFVAEVNSEIVGCMLFYDTFSTWKGKMLYLEDFV